MSHDGHTGCSSAHTHLPVLACACRWDDAIRVASSAKHPEAEALKSKYYK